MIDRKSLARQYQETPKPMGVGVVRNTTNGKSFIVAGIDLPSLLNRHQAQLRMNAHGNKALQRDWQAFGKDAFTFEVLDTLTPPRDVPDYDPAADLKELEAMWLEQLAPFEPAGYHRPPRP